MKVLVISHSCVVDVNQQLFAELNELPEIQVALMIPARWKSEYTGEMIQPTRLPHLNFPIFEAPVAFPGNISLHFYLALPKAKIRSFQPDVILSTQEPWSLSNLQAMLLAKEFGIPFAFQTNQNILKRYPAPFSWIEQAAYRHTAVALAYSEESRQVMLRKGLQKPSVVVPYATDTRQFIPQNTMVLREKWGLAGAIVIGYMGRLVPEKGLETLIDAFAEILKNERKSDIPLKLLFIGSGVQEEALQQRVASLCIQKDVIFTGAVPHNEAAKHMGCFDVFVLPSRTMPNWKEQFGRVIIEALACNIPVAGSNSGEIPNLIQATGGGLVFKEGDTNDLAQKLSYLIAHPEEREKLAKNGSQSVRERFTCGAVALQLQKICQQMYQQYRGGMKVTKAEEKN